jgi:alkylation response protein AidB-like acyl-CoA dehydrogenase
MDICLTAEQKLLQDTTAELAVELATSDPDDLPDADTLARHWRHIVDLGVPTLRSPGLCGLDASGVETAVIIEQVARTLCTVPVLGQAVLTTELLEAAGAAKELNLVAEGSLRLAPVLSADLRRFGATPNGTIAFDAAGATHALVAHESNGARQLICAPLDNTGETGETGLDLTRTLRRLPSDFAAAGSAVGDAIDAERWHRIEALALTSVAADLLGVMQGALDEAIRYAGDRVQFGVKIGSFQAVQHMLADALVRVEGARSCVWHAAWAIDHLPVDEARLAAMTAKAYASDAGRDVVETAVQVFGGIAITWEHVAHLRVRRMLLDRQLFGDETMQYEAVAAMRLADEGLG